MTLNNVNFHKIVGSDNQEFKLNKILSVSWLSGQTDVPHLYFSDRTIKNLY